MKNIFCLLILFASFLLTGCKDDIVDPIKPTDKSPKVIVNNEVLNKQIKDITTSSIILNGNKIPSEVKTGVYIVSDITDNTPNGYLRKVTSIENKGDLVIINTTDASLTEVVKDGSVEYHKEITTGDILEIENYNEKGELINTTRSEDDPSGLFFKINKEIVLFDEDNNLSTKDDQIVANGDMSFSLSLDFNIDIKDNSLKYLKTSANLKNNNTVSVSATAKISKIAGKSIKNEVLLTRWKLKPFTVIIAGIPVPIASNWIAVYMNAEGVVKAEIKTEIKNEASTEYGLEYVDKKWLPLTNAENNFNYTPFVFKGEASLKAGFAVQWEARPYGLGDSRVSLGPYLYGKVEAILTQDNLNTSAKLGCDVKAEATLQVFSQEIVGVNLTFPLFDEIIIWSGTHSSINSHRIVFTTAMKDYNLIHISMDAAEEDKKNIWIDLNGNQIKDNGEQITHFVQGEHYPYTFTSNEITIYGKVTYLSCQGYEITSLDTSKNPLLRHLDCSSNKLTSMDLTGNPALEVLICRGNQLTSLNVSNNLVMYGLECSNNMLSNLNLSNNTALKYFYCGANLFTELDISKNTELIEFWCDNNQLTKIELSNNTKLVNFLCWHNDLTELDLSGNPALEKLACAYNKLVSLNTSENENLKSLYCPFNKITSLDISKSKDLIFLDCQWNQITSLKLGEHSILEYISCENNQLTSLNVSNFKNLKTLNCYANRITSLMLNNNIYLEDLNCGANDLVSLDISKNILLERINCSMLGLSSLDISENTKLQSLDIFANLLSNLDVSKNQALVELICASNRMDADALNSIYRQLPDLRNIEKNDVNTKFLHALWNPGYLKSNLKIAQDKGWHLAEENK